MWRGWGRRDVGSGHPTKQPLHPTRQPACLLLPWDPVPPLSFHITPHRTSPHFQKGGLRLRRHHPPLITWTEQCHASRRHGRVQGLCPGGEGPPHLWPLISTHPAEAPVPGPRPSRSSPRPLPLVASRSCPRGTPGSGFDPLLARTTGAPQRGQRCPVQGPRFPPPGCPHPRLPLRATTHTHY